MTILPCGPKKVPLSDFMKRYCSESATPAPNLKTYSKAIVHCHGSSGKDPCLTSVEGQEWTTKCNTTPHTAITNEAVEELTYSPFTFPSVKWLPGDRPTPLLVQDPLEENIRSADFLVFPLQFHQSCYVSNSGDQLFDPKVISETVTWTRLEHCDKDEYKFSPVGSQGILVKLKLERALKREDGFPPVFFIRNVQTDLLLSINKNTLSGPEKHEYFWKEPSDPLLRDFNQMWVFFGKLTSESAVETVTPTLSEAGRPMINLFSGGLEAQWTVLGGTFGSAYYKRLKFYKVNLSAPGASFVLARDDKNSVVMLGSVDRNNRATDADLKKLALFGDLHSLYLKNCSLLTDNTLKQIGKLRRLRDLNLSGCTNELMNCFNTLGNLVKLQHLNLSSIPALRDISFVKHLCLKTLDLGVTEPVEGLGRIVEALGAAQELPKSLEDLCLENRYENNDGFAHLRPLAQLRQLRHLNIIKCIKLRNKIPLTTFLHEVGSASLKNLTELDITDPDTFDDVNDNDVEWIRRNINATVGIW